jgi:hypothetical protein
MPINFPTGATLNQVYTYNNLSWQWSGSYWKIFPSTGNFLPIAGGTLTGGLIAPTISATTYQNLPRDVFVTGGTYNTGTSTITFRNSTGGTFSVTGITAGSGSGGTGTVSGTVNYVAKFTGSTGVGNSIIYDTGADVGIGTNSPGEKLDVNGDALINGVTVGTKGDSTSTIVGANALSSLVGGISNTVFGGSAGTFITDGDRNLLIGYANYNNPDSTNITTQNNILSVSKNSDLITGYPQIWSPNVTSMGGPSVGNILELDPTKYSAIFLDYVLEGKDSTNMRAGTIKAVFLIDLSIIEWVEEALPEISNTTDYIFDVKNNGSGVLVVELTNNSNAELICNYTSRLLLRHYI